MWQYTVQLEKQNFYSYINPHLLEGNTQPSQYHAEESLYPDVNLPMQRIQQECQDVHIPPRGKPLDRSIMHDWKGVKAKRLDKKMCGGQINKCEICALVFTWIEACDTCFPLHIEECILWDLYTCNFHTFYPDERKCTYISKWRENWLWDLRLRQHCCWRFKSSRMLQYVVW